MGILERRIKDQRFLNLIRKAVNAGYLCNREDKTDIIGTPQGSIISPILANIYLHELDKYIESLKDGFDYKGPKKQLKTKDNYQYMCRMVKAKKIEDPVAIKKELHRLS